jgi:hypothetical protein
VSVQPYTSPEAPPPSTSTSTSGSNSVSIPSNAAVPDLAMVWGAAPSYAPSGSGGSNSNGPAAPTADDLSIDLGSLRDGENQMLSASSVVVDAYENLKQQFESVKDTVFGQQAQDTGIGVAPGDAQATAGGADGEASYGQQTTPDPIQSAAVAFANGQNGQPGMNDIQAYALQQIGDAMALVGEFVALMNAAGVNYAETDANSALPSADASS